jgi:hypothetical protein
MGWEWTLPGLVAMTVDAIKGTAERTTLVSVLISQRNASPGIRDAMRSAAA